MVESGVKHNNQNHIYRSTIDIKLNLKFFQSDNMLFRVDTISTYTVATCGTFKIGWTTILQFDILHELHNKAKKYFNCNYSSHPLIRTSPSVMKKWSHRRRSRSISTISVYLKSSLIREVVFGWSDLIRGEITVVKV